MSDIGAIRGLFRGEISSDWFEHFPEFDANERETLALVIDSIDKFFAGKEEMLREADRSGVFPDEYIGQLAEIGLFGLIIPEEFGGLGLSNAAYARVTQQVTRYDASTAITIGAHSSIGMKGLLLFGTPEQKARYLPKLASGETVAAFCLTEPNSGSDAASIRTKAEKQADGSWILNGDKLWITNGPIAEFFTVFARTDTPAGRMTAFIVERGFGGVTHGPKEDKMGIRASATSTVNFQNTRVPKENILGEEGQGFKVAMAILNNGRTGLGGGCVGAMKRLIDLATTQASERKQFGRPIKDFALIKEKLARMTALCYATESVVRIVAHSIDSEHQDYGTEAAASKVFATEALWTVAYEALQIAGGNGFMREYPYENIVRDSRINLIFEGTNEILRLLIASNGVKESGKPLQALGRALSHAARKPIPAATELMAFAKRNFSRRIGLNAPSIHMFAPELEREARGLSRYSQLLALHAEKVVRRYRQALVEEQLALRRLADVAVNLFVGFAVLTRVTHSIRGKGAGNVQDEIAIAKLATAQAMRDANHALERVWDNEDDTVRSLADHSFEAGRYRWDWW